MIRLILLFIGLMVCIVGFLAILKICGLIILTWKAVFSPLGFICCCIIPVGAIAVWFSGD